MSAGWIEICWSSGFVGPVDYTKSVMWVDFRWVDYNAGGLSVGRLADSDCWAGGSRRCRLGGLRLLGQWIEECWAGGSRSVGPVD